MVMAVEDRAASAAVADLAEQIERELGPEPAMLVEHDSTVLVHDRPAMLLDRMRSSNRMTVGAGGGPMRMRVNQHAVRIPVMARRRVPAESSMVDRRRPDRLAGRVVHALMMCIDHVPLAVDRVVGHRPAVRIDNGSTVTIEHVALPIERMMFESGRAVSWMLRRQDDRLAMTVRDGQMRSRVTQSALGVEVVPSGGLAVLVDDGTTVAVEDAACRVDRVMRQIRMSVTSRRGLLSMRCRSIATGCRSSASRCGLVLALAAEERSEEARPGLARVFAAAERPALIDVACSLSAALRIPRLTCVTAGTD